MNARRNSLRTWGRNSRRTSLRGSRPNALRTHRSNPRIKASLAAGLAATVALGLAGCDRGGNTDLGLALSTMNNPFFVGIKKGAQAEADARGLHLNITDAQNDPTQQINQMETFTSQNVKAAIINPVDSDAAVPAVGVANRAKVPVISIDRDVNGGTVGSTIASDNVAGGRLAAKTLAESLGGKGKVAFLEGQAGDLRRLRARQGLRRGHQEIPRHPGRRPAARGLRPHQGHGCDDQHAAGAPRYRRGLRRQ